MSFTVSKKNNKLIFNNSFGFQSRNDSTIWSIKEADKIYNWGDFSMVIHTGDVCKHDEYGYSKDIYEKHIGSDKHTKFLIKFNI